VGICGNEMKDSDERSTPIELFNELDAEFHFTLDVCAMNHNKKCEKYFNFQQDGLKQSWANEICWMNPPYSDIPSWLHKATNESIDFPISTNCIVVAILPMDGSTKWFHEYIWNKKLHKPRPGIQIRFPDKRYKFNNTNSAKFATIVVVFGWKK
jgi:phage N-6-adenine-methyltransferase